MRYQELTNKHVEDYTDEDQMRIIELLERDCQPFLSQSSVPLFRGMHDDGSLIGDYNIRTDRKSTSGPRQQVQTFVDAELSKHGYTALRGNSVFCSGNPSQAASYGALFVVFPKGDFHFTYNTVYTDFLGAFFIAKRKIAPHRDTYTSRIAKALSDEITTITMPHYKNEKNATIDEAASSRSEVLISASSYYAISLHKIRQMHKLSSMTDPNQPYTVSDTVGILSEWMFKKYKLGQ